MKNETIGLAGDGWGAVAAYNSLRKHFDIIEVVTTDNELLKIIRDEDRHISKIDFIFSKIIICAGYKPLINKAFFEKKEVINIHYSLLPKYRGVHSTVWAILNNDENLGFSIHLMNEYIDDGPIIFQYKVKNDYLSTATQYMIIFNNWIQENLVVIMKEYIDGIRKPIDQNRNEATWVGKRSFEDCKIDFTKNHLYIKNLFRALNPPYPRPFFRIKGKPQIFIVGKVNLLSRKLETHIGRILNIDENGIYISSADGYVILSEIAMDDGSKVEYSSFKIGTFVD